MSATSNSTLDPAEDVTWEEARPGDMESWLALIYFGLYLPYLFWSREGELGHWGTMVLLPLLLVLAFNRGVERPVVSALGSFGLRRGNLRTGLGVTILLGVVLGLVQVFFSRSGPQVLEAARNGSALYLFPLAFLLMLLLAGFTEEFFFRGFLQTRLEALSGSKWVALLVTALLFGVYHIPYAYFNPHWPSAGDWGAAWASALGQGIPGRLVLGGLYMYSRRNLAVCIVLHALVDTFPAMGLIKFGGG